MTILRSLPLLAPTWIAACASVATPPQRSADATASGAATPAPMKPFERFVGGEWRVTWNSGTTSFDTWSWGPGRWSPLAVTDGSDAAGNPMLGQQVVYWHPGFGQVRTLGGDGAGAGTIEFDGELATASVELSQRGAPRKLMARYAFAGPDRYRETLLEDLGAAGFAVLTQWDYARSLEPSKSRRSDVAGDRDLPDWFEPLAPLLRGAWESGRERADGRSDRTRSTFEWIPWCGAIHVRSVAPSEDGETALLLDAWLYRHAASPELRCLALTSSGGVYEGRVAVERDGALQLDLQAYEDGQVGARVVRLDPDPDGTLRERVWRVESGARTLLLDTRHDPVEHDEERRTAPPSW